MELTNEQLDSLERMAALFFNFNECAIALEVDEMRFRMEMKKRDSIISKTYYKGYLNGVARLRESVMELARRGSNPAQTQMLQVAAQTKAENAG